MKTLLTLILTLFLLNVTAQKNTYEEAMKNALDHLKQSATTSQFMESANRFERIYELNKKEWLPMYYTAQCNIIISYQETNNEKKEAILDKAQEFLNQAFQLAPEESELFALQAFLYPSRIMIDPMTRGMELVGKMNQALEEAIRLNPENPRSYYLRAITVLNMPENFGGGAAVAKPIFEKAREKFQAFQPKTAIYPNWGWEQNEAELNKL